MCERVRNKEARGFAVRAFGSQLNTHIRESASSPCDGRGGRIPSAVSFLVRTAMQLHEPEPNTQEKNVRWKMLTEVWTSHVDDAIDTANQTQTKVEFSCAMAATPEVNGWKAGRWHRRRARRQISSENMSGMLVDSCPNQKFSMAKRKWTSSGTRREIR